jgi:SSS family solute:Na+ symporter
MPEGLAAAGLTGWTSMPSLGSPIWYTLITTIVLGVGIGVIAQPQLVVRFMTVRNDRSLHRAIAVGGPFIMIMTGVAFTVGALTNVYYFRETGSIALTAAGGNVDTIIPNYINAAMPDAFIVIFMLALLSAAMSTLSSLFHTMGTALGHDLWGARKNVTSTHKSTQAATIVMILATIGLAYLMPANIIARATAMFMGLCAAALLPSFALALYNKSPSALAAKTSIVTGASVWFAWTAFIHVKESAALGISSFLFGKDALLAMPWQVVDPLVIALPLSTLALVTMKLWESRASLGTTEQEVEPF